jgi:hypothetical protein
MRNRQAAQSAALTGASSLVAAFLHKLAAELFRRKSLNHTRMPEIKNPAHTELPLTGSRQLAPSKMMSLASVVS